MNILKLWQQMVACYIFHFHTTFPCWSHLFITWAKYCCTHGLDGGITKHSAHHKEWQILQNILAIKRKIKSTFLFILHFFRGYHSHIDQLIFATWSQNHEMGSEIHCVLVTNSFTHEELKMLGRIIWRITKQPWFQPKFILFGTCHISTILSDRWVQRKQINVPSILVNL